MPDQRTRIAAIQMVSGPEVEANLDAAGGLLAEAAGRGARLAVLPEFFPIMGLGETDKVRAREKPGAGPAQGGVHPSGRRTHGDSMIVDPWGEVLARLPEGPGVITAELDRDRIAAVRASLPALEHRALPLPGEALR